MINKNFNDIAKIATAVTKVADELRKDAINFDLRDLTVNLTVSELELSIIDRDLFNITNVNGDKEYKPATTVKANVGGVQFVITARETTED
jgi:hypothetical protein